MKDIKVGDCYYLKANNQYFECKILETPFRDLVTGCRFVTVLELNSRNKLVANIDDLFVNTNNEVNLKGSFAEYQELVKRTRHKNNVELANYTLGLVCEAGELGDVIKKHLYHNHPIDKEKIISEMGDVLWYLSNICNVLGIELDDVATANIEKLNKRYPNGFESSKSISRKE